MDDPTDEIVISQERSAGLFSANGGGRAAEIDVDRRHIVLL